MPPQYIAKSVINKSLVAIKEHGILFECPFLDDQENKKYWVLGYVINLCINLILIEICFRRLFYTSRPKELYVCFQDGIPQNLIEIAFKINMRSVT